MEHFRGYSEEISLSRSLLGAQDQLTVADAIRETPATIVEALICFFSVWSIVGLWGYHTYLICRNITTNEDVSETMGKISTLVRSFVFLRIDQRNME